MDRNEAELDAEIGGPDDLADFQLQQKPNPPKGLKRINKVPLLIAAAVMVAFVLAAVWTMTQRSQAEAKSARVEVENAKQEEAAVAPRSATAAVGLDGYIPSSVPMDPTPAAIVSGPPTPKEIPDGLPPADGTGAGAAGDLQAPELTPEQQFAAQWRMERLEKLKEIENAKFDAQRTALQGDTGLSGSQSNAAAAAGLDPSALAALSGLAGVSTSGLDPSTAAQIESLQKLSAAALGGGSGADANRQSQADRRAFLAQPGESEVYLQSTRMPAVSAYELKAGWVIPGSLIGGINSDMPGQIIGQVRENVYDSATGRHLLIPQGSRLIGTYDTGTTFGQKRVLTGWTRIIYPDGSSLNLGLMPGSDRGGYAGFRDKTNNHYLSTFGSAFLISTFTAGVQLSQPRSAGGAGVYDSQQILAGELGRQLGQVGAEQAKRSLDRAATQEIRNGYKFNVMVTKDIILPPYKGR